MTTKNSLPFILYLSALVFAVSCEENDGPSPMVTIVTPADSTVVTEQFNVEVAVKAPGRDVALVELYLNDLLIGEDADSSYQFTVPVTGYTPGDYTLKAVARMTNGNTGSVTHQVTFAKPSLDIPQTLKVSKGDWGNRVTLEWKASTGAVHYEIFRLNDQTNTYEKIGTSDGTTYEDRPIQQPLKQYSYKVRAFNSATSFSNFTAPEYGYSSGNPYDQILVFGVPGRYETQFAYIEFMSMDDHDILYLSDAEYGIKKYSTDGVYWGRLGNNNMSSAPLFIGDRIVSSSQDYLVFQDVGQEPVYTQTGVIPHQMAADPDGNIYMASNYNLHKYDVTQNKLTTWGTPLNHPWGLAYYKGSLLMTSTTSGQIQFFTTSGQYKRSIDLSAYANMFLGLYIKDDYIYVGTGGFVIKTDMEGKVVEKIGEGYISGAAAVAIASNGDIIVNDFSDRKVRVLRKN